MKCEGFNVHGCVVGMWVGDRDLPKCGEAVVAVVQAADLWSRANAGRPISAQSTRDWRVLVQREMRARVQV
jgi:hypothetical protein